MSKPRSRLSQREAGRTDSAKRLAGKTTGVQVLTLPLAAVSSILATRILLESLGTELFASVSLVTGLFLLLPFLDFGTYAEMTNTVGDGFARGWSDELEARLRTAFRTLLVAGCVTIAAAVLLGVVGWGPLLGAPEASWESLGPFATLALSIFGVVIVLNSGVIILRGIRLPWLGTLLTGLVWPVTLMLILAFRAVGLDGIELGLCYPLALAALSCIAFIVGMTLSGLGRRKLLSTCLRLRSYPGSPIRAVTIPALVLTVGVAISSQLDRYLLAHFSTASAVADYVVGYQGYAALVAIPMTLGGALWPLLRARSLAGGTGAGSSLPRTIAVGAGLGAVIAVGYVLVMPWVFHAVTDRAMPWALAVAFAALLVAQAAIQLPIGLLSGPRGMRLRSTLVWMSLVCALPFAIAAASKWGSAGPVTVSASAILIFQVMPLMLMSRHRLASSAGTALV